MIKQCAICGATFSAGNNQKYCSGCKKEAIRRRNQACSMERERICEECGQPFIGGRSARFCPSCKRIRQAQNNKPKSAKICPVCGNEFMPHHNAVKFCSEKCRESSEKFKAPEAARRKPILYRTIPPDECGRCIFMDCRYQDIGRCPVISGRKMTYDEHREAETVKMLKKLRRAAGIPT